MLHTVQVSGDEWHLYILDLSCKASWPATNENMNAVSNTTWHFANVNESRIKQPYLDCYSSPQLFWRLQFFVLESSENPRSRPRLLSKNILFHLNFASTSVHRLLTGSRNLIRGWSIFVDFITWKKFAQPVRLSNHTCAWRHSSGLSRFKSF